MQLPKLRRRGRPRKFRGTKLILAIFFFTVLLLTAIWKVEEIQLDLRFGKISERLYHLQSQTLASVVSTNELLRAKLSASVQQAPDSTTRSIVLSYIHKYFGQEAPLAERVFTCESGLRPTALGVNKNGSTDRGVAQVNSSNRQTFERVTGQPYETFAHDVSSNLMYAKWLRDNSKGGWDNWTCYKLLTKQA